MSLKPIKVDEGRALYEFPLFLLFLACLHAGVRNLHDAFIELSERSPLALVLKEFRKIARLYVAIFNIERNHVVALAKLIPLIKVEWLRRFLAGYLVAMTTHGDALSYIEEAAKAALQRVSARTKTRYEHLTAAIEAVALVSTVLVFSLAFMNSGELALIASLPVAAMAFNLLGSLRMHAAELLVPKPDVLCYALVIASAALTALLLTAAESLPSRLGEPNIILPCILLPMASTAYVYVRWKKAWNHATKTVSALTSILEVLRIGNTATQADLLKYVKEDHEILSQLAYSLRTGHSPPDMVKGPRIPILPFFADIITTIMRSGVYATRIASIAYEVIVMLEVLLREADLRALIYEGALAAGLVILFVAAGIVHSVSLLHSYGVPVSVSAPHVTGLLWCSLPLVLSVMASALGIARSVRGSIAYSMLVPLMPLLLTISQILTLQAVRALSVALLPP